MIVITQILLLLVASAILLVSLGSRRSHAGRAWKKLGLVVLALAMMVAVIWPDITNNLAATVGVGRGADLLLYLLTVAFILYSLNNYLHRQDERDSTIRLARKIALLDANERYKIGK